MSKEKITEQYKVIFEEYFNSYYAENREVNNVSYRELFDGKQKSMGFTAELQYKNFKQNINVFWNNSAPLLVNSIFTFKTELTDFCCHFSDVLDYYDSDDISFYTYTHCTDKERTIDALNNVMDATKKYWNELNEVATTPSISQSIFEEVYSDEFTLEEIKEEPFDSIEEATDFSFFTYEILYKRDELKRHLKRGAKKNKLDTKFEKRAYRVLSDESFVEIRTKEKQRESSHSYSKSDKIFIGVLTGIFVALFAAIFVIIGLKIDNMLFADWIGRDKGDTFLSCLAVGGLTGLVVLALIPAKAFKPILSEKRYNALEAYELTEKSSKWMIALCGVGYVAICGFFLIVFCFNGMGFNSNGDIQYKEYFFSQVETYKTEETDIVIVKGYNSKGFHEYADTAYAFKLDDEWVDYGIPSDEARPIIEKAVAGKQLKTYETIDDIKD